MPSEKKKKAVALKYSRSVDAAPRVTAKGAGHIAEKIIALAREHGVPIHEDTGLVEVISTLDIYDEIPPELYKAVAEVLVFVYRLNKYAD